MAIGVGEADAITNGVVGEAGHGAKRIGGGEQAVEGIVGEVGGGTERIGG